VKKRNVKSKRSQMALMWEHCEPVTAIEPVITVMTWPDLCRHCL